VYRTSIEAHPETGVSSLLLGGLSLLLPLIGAFLVSVQLRLRLAIGTTLGADYDAQPLLVFPLLLLTSYAAALLFERFRPRQVSYLPMTLALALSFAALILFAPNLSLLQVFYFVVTGILLNVLIYTFSKNADALIPQLFSVWNNRSLIMVWTDYTVRSRYSQRILGILWIILLPLITGVIFSFVFSELIRIPPVDVPFLSFFLTALTFWSFFNQGVTNATTAVLTKTGLINQIYFPREILILVRFGETLVDFLFAFLTLLFINALNGILPNIWYIYLPLILLIESFLTLGVMFFISYLSVLIRDIPQLVGVTLQILFYLSPILYSTNSIPERFQVLVYINPLVPIIGACRDVLLYNRPPDVISLYYPLVFGCVLFYLGYRGFKANETRLADYL